jgi:hypothetical protein
LGICHWGVSEMGFMDGRWIELAQDRVHWRVLILCHPEHSDCHEVLHGNCLFGVSDPAGCLQPVFFTAGIIEALPVFLNQLPEVCDVRCEDEYRA